MLALDAERHLKDLISVICRGGIRPEIKEVLDRAQNPQLIDTPYVDKKKRSAEGRTPLAYAVAINNQRVVRDLVTLGADLGVVMGATTTALTLALTNPRRDGTSMVRTLLSMGADPAEAERAGIDAKRDLNITMQYWLRRAATIGRKSREELEFLAKSPPMHRMHELQYALVGQFVAIEVVSNQLTARFANPAGQSSPLVMLLLGPPGHGKTEISRNAARSLVGDDNFLEIACGNLRDDADLFGANLGGGIAGGSDGQLHAFLRPREGKNTIIFLDEFEKIKGLTSSLGWGQDKKMYQNFLEAWQEGTLTDQGGTGRGAKIDASRVVWILTSNWGQAEILDFSEEHRDRVYSKMDDATLSWVERELVTKLLQPLVLQEFKGISKELQALGRRINVVAPFLPFTHEEQLVVSDLKLRHRFQQYRAPAIHESEHEPLPHGVQPRLYGNLNLEHTPAYCRHVAARYNPMAGADSFTNPAGDADGKFITKLVQGRFGLDPPTTARVQSPKKPPTDVPEPTFWVHFDEDTDEVKITNTRPANAGDLLELDTPHDRAAAVHANAAPARLLGGGGAQAPDRSDSIPDPF